MLLLFTILLAFIVLSRTIENKTKIPSTLSLIVLSFLFSFYFPNSIQLSEERFDEILYLMLPMILLPDILNISTNELKKHYKEIVYLAFVAVVISIGIAVFITPYLLRDYDLSLGMLIALFAMLMATDAITVSSIMSKFRLPIKLKIYAESESLFNDVTALIIFYFIALPLISGENITFLEINIKLLQVLFLSSVIGVIVAYIGYFMMKIIKNSFDQLLLIYLIVSVSFIIAEHFEIAGILSIVTSVLTFKYLIKDQKLHQSHMIFFSSIPAVSTREYKLYKKESVFIGIFASAIVFSIVASMIEIGSLMAYYQEIIIIFILTSLIRLSLISAMTWRLQLPFRWAKALTYSGTKGALAIIMVHSLQDTFIYKEMFTAIVIGNVLLSTFVYTFLLMYHINTHTKEYELETNTQNKKDI